MPAYAESVSMMPDEYSRVPSGMMRPAGSAPSFQSSEFGSQRHGGAGAVLWALVLISVLLSSAAFYNSLFGGKLSPNEKAQLKEIAESLRQIQQKDITMTMPLKTTAYVDEAIPVADVFPKTFALPIEAKVAINEEVPSQTTSGQVVPLKINATIPIKASVGLDPAKGSEAKILIKKEIPIDTQFSVTLRVQAMYGKELNSIIDKMETLSR